MKTTFIRTDKKNKRHLKLVSLGEMVQALKGDDYYEEIVMLHDFCRLNTRYATFRYMHRLPFVCPSAEMKADKDGNLVMKVFNGLLTLTIGALNNHEEAEVVKRMAAVLPMTVLAVCGSSRRTVKVVVRVSRPDGTLPQTEDEALRLCRQAYPLVSQFYEVAVRRAGTTNTLAVGPALRQHTNGLLQAGFRITYDPKPYYNANAAAMLVPDELGIDSGYQLLPEPDDMQADDDGGTVGQETRQLIDLLEQRYSFRMNKVMGYVEYKSKTKAYYPWLPVDERAMNSLAIEARLSGLNVWDKDVSRYVKSNMIRNYNPVEEYLFDVSDKWDGRDYIKALADTVPTNNPHWPLWFRTWFLGMVVQWLGRNPRYGNATAPLLISKQGYNKSTFCRSLLPPELQWGYNDNLVLSEKKSVLQAMSQFLLINLDEFNQISPKVQEGFLKNLIQLASVKVKRPYGKHVEDFPRLASFIATANMTDLLADPTGNRRFIGIELTGPIDVKRRINYPQLYAQAMTLLDHGEPYWFDEQQTRLVMESNRQFQLRSPEESFFHECFTVTTNEDEGQWMTAAAILHHVRQYAGSVVRGDNIRAFGRFLSNLTDMVTRHTRYGTEYLVVQRK
jgi:hypothetical protein